MTDSAYRRRGSRFRARSRAVSLLFEADLRDTDPVSLAAERREMGQSSAEEQEVPLFAIELVNGTTERMSALDDYVSEHLQGWTLERLPAMDRAILRAASWELLFGPEDTPPQAVIQQAVGLTEELAAPKSVPFVNAVLDQIAALADQIRAAEKAVSSLADTSGDDTPEANAEGTSDGDEGEAPSTTG